MRIELENIGMLKKASVKIDGLTVIAGENDTGKSTASRAIYYKIKEEIIQRQEKNNSDAILGIGALIGFGLGLLAKKPIKGALGGVAVAGLINTINENKEKFDKNIKIIFDKDSKLLNPIMINSTEILDTANYIKTTQMLAQQKDLKYTVNEHIIDLILQLTQTKLTNVNDKIIKDIEHIIGGKIYYDTNKDDFLYQKDILDIPLNMNSTATGIKAFGLLQILLLNGTIKKDVILILDEPEANLHPKWQLKYAETIVKLVKYGVKVVFISHSPYMIEALKRYSDKEGLCDKSNFYLAEGGYIEHQDSLENIFEKLSVPMRELKELKWQSLNKN